MNQNLPSCHGYGLIGAQALNSFGDFASKISASYLVAATMSENQAAIWAGIISFIYIVPYVILSPFVGKITDRFPKAAIVKFSYLLQGSALLILSLGAYLESLAILITGLVGVAVQSCLLAPARNALLGQIFGKPRLGWAMGLLELVAIGATLIGLAVGGWSFDQLWALTDSPWRSVAIIGLFSSMFAFLGHASVFSLQNSADNSSAKASSLRKVIQSIWKVPGLKWPVLGMGWFYGAGTMLILLLMQDSRWDHAQTAGAASQGGFMAALLGVGAAAGSGLAALLCRKRIEIGLAFVGAIGMSLLLPLTAFVWENHALASFGILAVGVMAGLFSAPLHAVFVASAKDEVRASTIAIGNAVINLISAAFVGLQTLLSSQWNWSPESQLYLLAGLSIVVVFWMSFLVPESLLRVFLLGLVKVVYPTRIKGLQSIPKEGGVLMVSNHVSYMDAILIYAASNRPVRFIGGPSSIRFPFIKWAYKRFNVINISSQRAKEAIVKTVEALKQGDVVCIFPEGRLTRTGTMYPFKRGATLIARKAGSPVLPVYIDGMWGSIFSFAHKPFKIRAGMPLRRKIGIQFGETISSEQANTESMRDEIMKLGYNAYQDRKSLTKSLGYAVLESVKQRQFKTILVDRGAGRQTSNGTRILTAGLLLSRKIRRLTGSNRIGLLLPPGLAGAVTNLGAVWSGKSPVNLNPTVSVEGFKSMICTSKLDTVITSRKFLGKFPDLPLDGVSIIEIENLVSELRGAKSILCALAGCLLPTSLLADLFGINRQGGNKEAVLMFSSGSSSLPKGIPLSHHNILSNVEQLFDCRILQKGDRLLGNLPLFHSFGYTGGLWFPLLKALTLVTVRSPLEVKASVDAIREETVTVLLGTPTFLRPYLRKASSEDLGSLRIVIAGAEKTPPEFSEAWKERFGIPLLEGYGMTECSPVIAANCLQSDDLLASKETDYLGSRDGSVGRTLPGMWVRVVSSEKPHVPVKDGESGLLLVKGPNVFSGYLKEDNSSKGFSDNGWLNTGDIGRFDEDGFLFIEGRLERFSKIGGEMVPHMGVEEAIAAAYPEWSQSEELSFVVGSKESDRKGEELVLLTRFKTTLAELRSKLAGAGLPNLWVPQSIKRVDCIPCLGSGKLDLKQCLRLCREV